MQSNGQIRNAVRDGRMAVLDGGPQVGRYERDKLHKSVDYQGYVLVYARHFAFYAFLLGFAASGGLALAYSVIEGLVLPLGILLTFMGLMGLVFAGGGGMWAVYQRGAQFDEEMREFEEVEMAATSPPMVVDDDDDGSPTVTRVRILSADGRLADFEQPRPGEFAAWLVDVLNENSKVNLSQNTAQRRGWNIAMYKNMWAQMKLMGWFYEGQNRTPTPTDNGKLELGAWLRNTPPPQN